jgi:hypothetical protein
MTDDHGHVTARDITELLHHLADLGHSRSQDPAERAAFLTRKAELLDRIADQHAVGDPAYSEQARQMAADARTACGDDIETTTGPDRCPVCHTGFTRIRRQRFCSETCRKTAWRRRHADPPTPPVIPAARRRRDLTIYACPDCDTRYHAQQRCEDCNTWCARVGPGGPCPHCDLPVAVTDLFDQLPTPQVTAASPR